MDDCFDKYRLNEALMAVYKLFWDEFSSWYLELVKPGYEQPVDALTYQATLGFFDALLRLLHPFMPFITEELWQALTPRKAGDSVMIAAKPDPLKTSERNDAEACLHDFETIKALVAHIRTVRQQKNLPNKEALVLEVLGQHNNNMNAAVMKMGNIADIHQVTEKSAGAVSFLVHTTEYAIPLKDYIDMAGEKSRIEEEIRYLEGFLASVMKKLDNPNFIANAKPEVILNEKNKKEDTENKIRTLRENLKRIIFNS